MPRIARVHNNPNTNIHGVDRSDIINPDDMFNGVHDPLMDGNRNLAAKAGSSIPSMFARMIFFRTAFSSVRNIIIAQGSPVPVYNELVSQCFNLLEMVYNQVPGLEIKEYNYATQIDLFTHSEDHRHRVFAENLRKQHDLSLANLQNTYLFLYNGTVIGGTSPFSVVFTSPNWHGNGVARSLLERESGFKTFVYKMMSAYNASGMLTDDMTAFYNYVRACMMGEGVDFPNYTYQDFENEYPPCLINNATIYVNVNNVTLRHRAANQFSSDFFVNSTQIPFDVNKTPLVLVKGQHPGMRYYDKEMWPQNLDWVQVERERAEPRKLPGCDAYRHDFFTEIDIFEDKLLALPFPINEAKFGYDIPINDGNDLYHAMLPLKPLLLQYFSKEDLSEMMTLNCNENSCHIVLNIPVFNGSTRNFIIRLEKTYSFADDVVYIDEPGMDTSLNVGISPFYQLPNHQRNDYWVMGSVEQDSNCDINLHFYVHGIDHEMPTRKSQTRCDSPLSKYYNIAYFDYLQVEIVKNGEPARCLVTPLFDAVQNGREQYFYGIDFGTTNTHIAFYSRTSSGSFGESDFASFATFINVAESLRDNVVSTHEDKLRVAKARQFFPQTTRQNHYLFPIRTALNANATLQGQPLVFCEASIGFHYVKEIVPLNEYITNVKWAFMNNVADANASNAVSIFFTEILYMIKHHWMMEPNADKNQLPQIRVTFPGTDRHLPSIQKWTDAYNKVFNLNNVVDNPANPAPQAPIYGMVESLAPCAVLLNNDQALRVNGFLNIDIGGGTTDLQYYKHVGAQADSYYDSIRFAGDDLWGQGYENMAPTLVYGNISDNNFTILAQSHLANSNIVIDGDGKNINNITLRGKELINCLFRDEHHNFENVLRDTQVDNEIRKCRLQMLLHYSAIIYHSVHWLEVNGTTLPAVIKTSGLGSRYLSLLFENQQSATVYTKYIISKFSPTAAIPYNFEVRISDGTVNPKTITAEGAATSLAVNHALVLPQDRHHLGLSGYTHGSVVTIGNLNDPTLQSQAHDYFDAFVDAMASVNFNTLGGNLSGLPYLSSDEANALKHNARASLLTIITAYYDDANRHNQNLDQSLFVWGLKDSLWRL